MIIAQIHFTMKRRPLSPLLLAVSLSFSAILPAQESSPSTTHGEAKPYPTVDVTGEYKIQRLYSRQKFDCPTALAVMPLPQPRLVLALQRGEFWLLPKDEVLGKAVRFLDLRERLKKVVQFEEGVHGLAFHPDFATNRKFYVSYSMVEPTRSVLSEFRTRPGEPFKVDMGSERILLEVPHIMSNHFGGGLAFGPDKKLYMTIGDGGLRDDPYHMSQNPFVLNGKMLRLDVDVRSGSLPYGIPSDNPFFGQQEYRQEIWALGLRNPWGFAFDQQTGDLWLADVGQDHWEEVNIIKKGLNYGWSDRDGPRASTFRTHPLLPDRSYENPVHYYTHAEGISVTGGFMYHGNRLPKLKGCYIYGDWGFGTLWGLRYQPDNQIISEHLVVHRRQEAPDTFFNPTMISADADGEIMIMSQEGAIYTLIDSEH